MAELELWWSLFVEIGMADTERVKVGDVVAADLVGTDKELDLKGQPR